MEIFSADDEVCQLNEQPRKLAENCLIILRHVSEKLLASLQRSLFLFSAVVYIQDLLLQLDNKTKHLRNESQSHYLLDIERQQSCEKLVQRNADNLNPLFRH